MFRVIKWLFILLAVVAAVVAGILFSKDAIARAAVEQQLRAQTGMDVKIGRLSLGIMTPVARLENVVIYNSANFGGVPFLNIRALHVEFDREALAHRELRLKLVKLDVAELAVVRNDRGETNIFALAAAPKSARNAEMIDFKVIEVANFTISKAAFVDLTNQRNNRQFSWNVQNRVFRDLKSSAEFYAALVQLWEQRPR